MANRRFRSRDESRRQALFWVMLIIIGLTAMMTVTVLFPAMFVDQGARKHADNTKEQVLPENGNSNARTANNERKFTVPVFLSKEKKVITLPLEDYVRGVVAAEMPIEFELEALKAQAITARTYIVRRMAEGDYSDLPAAAAGAAVTDTVMHQAYMTDKALRSEWGALKYKVNMDKITRAVEETKDLIITYEDKPINATFFSTSNGYTENSEDYWNVKIPYLRSVPSPWDKEISPKYKTTAVFPIKDLMNKLGINSVPASASTAAAGFKVLEWTEGHRIKTIRIGGQNFTGRQVREKLGLNSSQFAWSVSGSKIIFTTYGYGHGVGMSQWGANGMAMEGKTADDILKYYYQGVELGKIQEIKTLS